MKKKSIIFFMLSSICAFAQEFGGYGDLSFLSSSSPQSSSGITNTTLGLTNWWKMDENTGTTAADSADSSTGTFASTPTWTTGQINSALSFSGTSKYLNLSTNTGVGASAFTVSAWIKMSDATSDGYFIYDSDGDNNAGFWLRTDDGKVSFNLVCSGGDMNVASDVSVLPDGVFTHVVATWSGASILASTVHIYTNAVEVGYHLPKTDGAGAHSANTLSTRYIGPWEAVAFSGVIDDLRVWNRVLTSGEITNVFQWRGEP